MNEFVRKVLEERFVSLHELFASHILDSPEERYLNLQKERPELLNSISSLVQTQYSEISTKQN